MPIKLPTERNDYKAPGNIQFESTHIKHNGIFQSVNDCIYTGQN